jgi:hypothetical protein
MDNIQNYNSYAIFCVRKYGDIADKIYAKHFYVNYDVRRGTGYL